MPDFYIPPAGVLFRLLGYGSGYVVFSNFKPDGGLNHFSQPKNVYDDQWFELVPGTGTYEGYHLVKSWYTNTVIVSQPWGANVAVGMTGQNGKDDNNWFKIEPGERSRLGYFRLQNYATNKYIVSRAGDNRLEECSADCGLDDDQFFSFDFEDMEIERVEYDTNNSLIRGTHTEQLAQGALTNDTESQQTMELVLTGEKTQSSSFTYTGGFAIRVGASGRCGLPFVADGQINTEISTTHSFQVGRTESKRDNYSARFPVVVPPHTKINATYTIRSSTIEVPCTIYSRSRKNGYEVSTKAQLSGVRYWGIDNSLKSEQL